MMKLIQSIVSVRNVQLKRAGLFRYEIQEDMQTDRLYMCEKCGRFEVTHNVDGPLECGCAPCLVCKKSNWAGSHSVNSVGTLSINTLLYPQGSWYPNSTVSSVIQKPKRAAETHAYAPERRKVGR